MKTILYTPRFVNPHAYDIFPQLGNIIPNAEDYFEYARFSGTLIVSNINDNTDYQTFQNTNEIDLSNFAGKLIQIDLQTVDGKVALGQWRISRFNDKEYNYLLLENTGNISLEDGDGQILLEIQ